MPMRLTRLDLPAADAQSSKPSLDLAVVMEQSALKDFRFLDASLNWMFWDPARIMADSAWVGHIPFAHWLMSVARPGVVVELGTHSGVSFAAFCNGVVRLGIDCECIAVDTWEGEAHAGYYGEQVYNDLAAFIAAHFGTFTRLLRMTFDDALAKVPDGTVDVLHIDGFHSYEAVSHDFNTWLPKLSPRAVVLFHDVAERNKAGFGVWQFWDELTTRYPGFAFEHSSGLGVLQVGPEAPDAVKALCNERDPRMVRILQQRFQSLSVRHQLHVTMLRHNISP